MGDHGEYHGKAAPIEPQPPVARPLDIVTVQIGDRIVAGAAILVERMFKAEIVQGNRRYKIDEHDRPADIFVRAQRLDEYRQDRDQDQVDAERQNIPDEIFDRFIIKISLDRLECDGGDGGQQQRRNEHERHSQCFRRHIGPVRQGGRIDDLVHLAVAVPPNQFAGIIDGDDERDDRKGSLQHTDQGKGDREQRCAVYFARRQQSGTDIEQTDQHQDEKGRAAKNHPHFQAHLGPELRPCGRSRLCCGQMIDDLWLGFCEFCRLLALFLHLPLGDAALGEGEFAISEAQGKQGYADRNQAVIEQRALQCRQHAVALRHRPIFGNDRQRAQAERFEQCSRVLPFWRVADNGQEAEIEDEKGDDRDIGVDHRTGRGGDRKEDRGGQENTRQRQYEIGKQIIAEPVGSDGFGIQPRHQAADEYRQRHADKGDGGDQKGADKATEQIVEFAHPGGADHRTKAAFIIAHDHIGDKGGGHEHEEYRQDLADLHDRRRRVDVDIAAASNGDILRGHRAEGQQEEEDGDYPENRVAQLVAQFEGSDFGEHRLYSRVQAAICGALSLRAPTRVAK